ncbi:hypothetical protein AFK24_01190 [Pseudomonas syringae]|uniref:DUF3077 domain-containing protein n=1 Tax=Pseudomonas syringae TaxID=317 RepID=A0A1C7Z9Z8_PSESX|nr:DUF3077 domain-containing protein [Pseudomonas syringae]OCR26771.1 hypothetical protein AFK24_01190 [Pseudomonas syringae]
MNKRLSPVSCNSGHFLVQPNITLQHALEQAVYLLASASTLSAETSDADLQTCRSMNGAIQHLIDMSRHLIEASVVLTDSPNPARSL